MSESNNPLGLNASLGHVLETDHPISSSVAEETTENDVEQTKTMSSEYREESSIIKTYDGTVPRDETDQDTANAKEADDELTEFHNIEKRIEPGEYRQRVIDEVQHNRSMYYPISSEQHDIFIKQEDVNDNGISAEQPEIAERTIDNDEIQEQADKDDENQTEEQTRQRKRKITFLDEFKIVDPSTLTMETSKKRVPGKLIDRLWEPLDPQTLDSIDRLLNIALTMTIERYGNTAGSGKFNKKMIETQKVIAKTWLNVSDSKSFRSRLEVTKVPAPSSMATNKSNEISDILSYDQLSRRKTFLETYLNAELKQLSDLQKHYQGMEVAYQSDLEYLEEFRKTTASHAKDVNKDITNIRESLGLDARNGSSDNIKLTSKTDTKSSFNPDEDDATKELLQSLHSHLQSISSNTEQLGSLNDKLELVYNILDML
ncbi:hypothetical protein G9P44_000393 [Scheffersomyces stipitis]|nr:hypothetical protein G9P44_000393 [Scheffersomyces stipitis]